MKKIADKIYQFPWTRDHVESRIFSVLDLGIFPSGLKGEIKLKDQVVLNVTTSGKLQVIDCRFNDEEVYLIFGAEAYLDKKNLPVVVLATIPKDWKPGDKIKQFYGLEAIKE